MTFIELLRLISENLHRMRFRVTLTAFGVFIGTSAIILLVSIGNGLQSIATSGLSDLGSFSQLSVYNYTFVDQPFAPLITEAKLDEWRALDKVTAVTPIVHLSAQPQIKLNRHISDNSIMGIDPTQVENFDLELQSGQWQLANGTVVVSANVGKSFFNERTAEAVAEPLELQGETLQLIMTKRNGDGSTTERKLHVRVAGVLAPSSDLMGGNAIYMDIKTVQALNQWVTGARFNPRRDGYEFVWIQTSDPAAVSAIDALVKQDGYTTFALQSIWEQFSLYFVGLQVAFGCLGSVSLVVAAFGIANTMIMAVYERTPEIGLMKAVGANNRDVMLIFLGEASAISLRGGIGGIIVGTGVGQLANVVVQNLAPVPLESPNGFPQLIQTPAWLIISALLFSLLVGLLSGIYPAWWATRLDPITALSYE